MIPDALSPIPYDHTFYAFISLTLVAHLFSTQTPSRARAAWRKLRDTDPGNRFEAVKQPKISLSSTLTEIGDFISFRRAYLAVYLLAVTADWVQGPYVYALYTGYGYEKADVGQLYIAGFASSAVFGTLVASVSDKYGRRRGAQLYCVAYILSCATKSSGNFWVLFLGRILGGVAYSILFSAFEAWMVCEHAARGFSNGALSETFASAQLLNGVVAIVSGRVAGGLAERYGKVAPFNAAIAVLAVLLVVVSMTWRENYGDRETSVVGGFGAAWKALWGDSKILLVCFISSAFEGAMYTFTFIWTPALQVAHDQAAGLALASLRDAAGKGGFAALPQATLPVLPLGTVFASFMCATMVGSSLFVIIQRHVRVEVIMCGVFGLSAALFGALMFWQDVRVIYGAFVLFEVLCGVYFPAMATMRAPYLPEENRSALLTFARVPLNIIVVLALYEDLTLRMVFVLCASCMIVGFGCQRKLLSMVSAGTHVQVTQVVD